MSSTKGEKMKSYRYTMFVVAVFFGAVVERHECRPGPGG
jgi:hypothetical protein